MIASIDLIKSGLQARIDALVPQLFPNAVRDGMEWRLGDIFGAPGQSLAIRRGGGRFPVGSWKDFCSGASGDVIDLVAAGMCHGDVGAAIGWARDWLGLGSLSPAERARREREAEAARVRAEAKAEADAEKRRKRALAMFLAGAPLPGTPADAYLVGRGIVLARLGRAPGGLRFHAGLMCPETGVETPAMVAVVNRPDGEFLAVHRTFLRVRPDGGVTKAAMREAKLAYGAYAGGVIPLWRGASGKALAAAPAGEWLHLSEGIEDGLSVALAIPQARVAAALSLSNLGNVRLPKQMGGIVVCAQNDEKPAAREALDRAVAALRERSPVRIVRPPAHLKDWNDWLRALTAAEAPAAPEVAA